MRRWLMRIALAGLWIGFIGLAWFMSQNGDFGRMDFRVYVDAAHLLLNGQPLYHGTEGMIYLYPPLLAQAIMPLAARLSLDQIWALWFGFNVALLLGTVALLSRQVRPRWALWLIAPLFMPLLEALYLGQVTIILLALFTGAWLAIRRERRFAGGALLALAAWIKVFPALVIVYFVWKRDWRVVRGALIGGAALGLLQIAVSGVAPLISMAQTLAALNGSGQDWTLVRNASVFGFTAQLFEAHAQIAPLVVSPALFWISRAGITLALIVGLLYVTARSDDFEREYSLALLTSMLVAPTLFPASMPPLLLVFVLLLRRPSKRIGWWVGIAAAALSIYWLYTVGYAGDPPVSGLVLSFGFYTLMALWGVNAVMLRPLTPSPSPTQAGRGEKDVSSVGL